MNNEPTHTASNKFGIRNVIKLPEGHYACFPLCFTRYTALQLRELSLQSAQLLQKIQAKKG